MSTVKRIQVCALGGTICSMANDPVEEYYNSASIKIEALLELLPIDKNEIEIQAEQLFQKISQDITYNDLLVIAKRLNELAQQDEVDGIVVTQGTNSIEEIVFFVSLLVKTHKPIVFTGAFRPYSSFGYDGLRNLFNAIVIAGDKQMKNLGILLTFNDCIVLARDAVKLDPSILGNFVNSNNVLGLVHGRSIHLNNQTNYVYRNNYDFSIENLHNIPKVCIIYGHQGMDDLFVRVAIENGFQGIISAGLGKGYQPEGVTKALIEASNKGIIIVRCSRTGYGTVRRDPRLDDKFGMVAGGSLNPQKALILLALALTKTDDKSEIQKFFDEY